MRAPHAMPPGADTVEVTAGDRVRAPRGFRAPTAPLTGEDWTEALALVENTPDATAALLLAGALRRMPEGCRGYGQWHGDALTALVVLLPELPPFAVPVLLPAGDVGAELLATAANREPSPQMALGPLAAVERLLAVWPAGWYPYLNRRPELLLRQERPHAVPHRADVSTRWARPEDIPVLARYRTAMERDSGTAIVSTENEAREVARSLVERDAVMVIEMAGELAGCAAICVRDERHEQLGFVYVEPPHRRRGVSDQLLAALCADIHGRGRNPVTFTANGGALHRRLSALGFQRIGDHLKAYFEASG